MVKRKMVLALAVPVVLGVLGALAVAQAQRARGSLTALDYAEIQQLYSRYAIGVDSGNGEMFAGVFTPDGTFELPSKTIQGRKQLAEIAMARRHKRTDERSHVAVNIVIEPSPERRDRHRLFSARQARQKGESNTLTGGGIYRDTFVKTSEGWRIKKRVVQPAHSVPPTKTQ